MSELKLRPPEKARTLRFREEFFRDFGCLLLAGAGHVCAGCGN
jgi:hypothetical protein